MVIDAIFREEAHFQVFSLNLDILGKRLPGWFNKVEEVNSGTVHLPDIGCNGRKVQVTAFNLLCSSFENLSDSPIVALKQIEAERLASVLVVHDMAVDAMRRAGFFHFLQNFFNPIDCLLVLGNGDSLRAISHDDVVDKIDASARRDFFDLVETIGVESSITTAGPWMFLLSQKKATKMSSPL